MRDRRHPRLRQISVALISLVAIGYFGVHATQGKHGFSSRQSLIDRRALIETEIAKLEAVRARLAQDVALLNLDPPDSDIVEEFAGELFGMVKAGEHAVVGRPSTASGRRH
jgi:cell division protein FtsB